jgi:hypothetical protein
MALPTVCLYLHFSNQKDLLHKAKGRWRDIIHLYQTYVRTWFCFFSVSISWSDPVNLDPLRIDFDIV